MNVQVHVHGSGPAALIAIDELVRHGCRVSWSFQEPALWHDVVRMRDGLWVPTDPDDDVGNEVLRRLVRLRVPFDRRNQGSFMLHRGPAGIEGRFLRCGVETGRAIQACLARAVEARELQGSIETHGSRRLVDLAVSDAGRCVGLALLDIRDSRVQTFRAAAVVLADHGLASLPGPLGTHPRDVGRSLAVCVRRGMPLERSHRFDHHPWTIPGVPGRCALPWEVARGLRDPSSASSNGLERIDPRWVEPPWAPIAEDFARRHAAHGHPPIGLAIHRSLGGLWVDGEHGMTILPGLFAARPCAHEVTTIEDSDPHALYSALRSGVLAARGAARWAASPGEDAVRTEDPARGPGSARIRRLLQNTRRSPHDLQDAVRGYVVRCVLGAGGDPHEEAQLLHHLETCALATNRPWMNRALLERLDALDEVLLARVVDAARQRARSSPTTGAAS